ncbi:MAG: lytic transglycosylase domain-containing protein [Bacteroidales bacterium]|nr:lytic transglycosylase domain-containing protein [Bacteroidales bacterium]
MENTPNKRQKALYFLSSLAIVFSLTAIALGIFVFATQKPDDEDFYRQSVKDNLHNFSAPLPQTLTFCGEDVPLDNVFVREALDRELTALMYQHSTTFLVLKRAWRFFPEIEQYLKDNSAPEDLKYLCVAESSLANVTSPAKAEGFWQFMPTTAKQYNLVVKEDYDERYNLKKATTAAVKYLKGSRSRLGNWALACAAYNCGEGNIKNRIAEQGTKSYWNMALNLETARYVYRILAYKILMQNPQQYGYYLRKQDAYQPLKYKNITIDSTINDLPAFCKQNNISYKYFKLSNPELRTKKLINKEKQTYTFRIPTQDSYSWKKLTDKLNNSQDYIDKF